MTIEVPTPPVVTSLQEFRAAVPWALDASAQAGARRIVWVDPDFSDWPLDDPVLLDALTAWLRRPGRRLVLLAADYDRVPRDHPRFVAWRRLWSHAVEPWMPSDGESGGLPTMVHDDGAVVLRIIDRLRWRGSAMIDSREARTWRDQTDAALQHSTPAFPVSTLGL